MTLLYSSCASLVKSSHCSVDRTAAFSRSTDGRDLAPQTSTMGGTPLGIGEGYGDVVKRVLLTGMSGTGKSTLIGELAAHGYKAVDLDADEWSEWVEVARSSGTPHHPRHPWNRAGTGSGERIAFKTSYPPKTPTCCLSAGVRRIWGSSTRSSITSSC